MKQTAEIEAGLKSYKQVDEENDKRPRLTLLEWFDYIFGEDLAKQPTLYLRIRAFFMAFWPVVREERRKLAKFRIKKM